MNRLQEVDLHRFAIQRYEAVATPGRVEQIQVLAKEVRERLDGRVIWHVNSTAAGGGVAEMLPSLLGYLRGLGLDSRWLVISGEPEFFRVTKRLHHALHGEAGDGSLLDESARTVYEQTLRANAAELVALVRPGDIVLLHDPQTIGLAPYLDDFGAHVLWRCHIGRSVPTVEAQGAWDFLAPYVSHAQTYVFSREEYVPIALDHGKSRIFHPSIDAFSAKNQDMDENTAETILVHTGLVACPMPANPNFEFRRSDGSSGRVDRHVDIIRCGQPVACEVPLVVQVSRWDPLKDPIGVMEGFARYLGQGADSGAELVLAGPSVRAVADDPEGPEIFRQLFNAWCELPHAQRTRVHLAMLPMVDIEENAAIVNALQRHAAVVVQKSLQEGFGLTVTEAMWKGRPVIASRVGGIQEQIEDGVNGLLLNDPTDLDEFAVALGRVLGNEDLAQKLGQAARDCVRDRFLETRSLLDHLNLVLTTLGGSD